MGIRRSLPDTVTEDAPLRVYELREVYNVLRYIARSVLLGAGCLTTCLVGLLGASKRSVVKSRGLPDDSS